MVEKPIILSHKVIEFSCYQQVRSAANASAISARICRHCGAPLLDGENEDECSSALNTGLNATAGTARLRTKARRSYVE